MNSSTRANIIIHGTAIKRVTLVAVSQHARSHGPLRWWPFHPRRAHTAGTCQEVCNKRITRQMVAQVTGVTYPKKLLVYYKSLLQSFGQRLLNIATAHSDTHGSV